MSNSPNFPSNQARLPVRAEPKPNGAGRRSDAETVDMMPVFEEMVINGHTNKEIAERLGVSVRTITDWRKKVTREPRRNATGHIVGTENAKLTSDCLRLFSSGLTYLQIAEEVGVSYETVRARLSKAYASFMESQRDSVAGRQYADLQVLKAELLELIIRDHMEDLNALANDNDVDIEDEQGMRSLIEKAFNKGRKNSDTKLAAIDRYLRVLEREAKLFGIDQNNVNVTVNHRVDPATITLLQRLEESQSQPDDIIDGDIVDDTLQLGSM